MMTIDPFDHVYACIFVCLRNPRRAQGAKPPNYNKNTPKYSKNTQNADMFNISKEDKYL